ncbi:TSUP family transporter [Ferrimonas lipolytica]|uniref:Probable membrane transporter protein n=1 Tax=Ferrimonas lipolytica TaxID=2724191 RepID=A0A6H1UEE5_9GAMM|nr:TSUP family transporter [Ferrimonas lipolytica]QIZ77198.1 TSUP family transporter [Ferrimonas lipolytica]
MELALSLEVISALAAVAFVAGFVDAIAGGGGLLTIPALLTAGLPPHLALGTNKLAASFGSATAGWTFYKKQLFTPAFWKRSVIGTFIGAAAGTLFVSVVSVDWLDKLLPLLIMGIAIYTLFGPNPKEEQNQLPKRDNKLFRTQWIQGLSIGFYDGFAGPGTGAFWTVSNMMLYRINIMLSSGLARSMNFVSNATSLGFFIALGHVNFGIGIAMGVALMGGAWLGAHSAIRFGSRFIRPVFITVVMIIAAKLAWNAWL